MLLALCDIVPTFFALTPPLAISPFFFLSTTYTHRKMGEEIEKREGRERREGRKREGRERERERGEREGIEGREREREERERGERRERGGEKG